MPQDFPGINEKLKRANENIRNFDSEIVAFIEGGEYPVLPDANGKIPNEAISYHKNRIIPPRFGVLTGEIIHHFRSCFDHLVWHFSEDIVYRDKNAKFIDCPILEERPTEETRFTQYDRKIKGILNPKVLKFIGDIQPYNIPDPDISPLLAIHKMDIRDKHREIILHYSTGAFIANEEIYEEFVRYTDMNPHVPPVNLAFKFKGHGKLVPNISFKKFCGRPVQPVIPALQQLHDFVVRLIGEFAKL